MELFKSRKDLKAREAQMMTSPKKIYFIAGEPSGDQLGGLLMKALKERRPDIDCYGIGGPAMEEKGLKSLFPMSELSLIGLFEIFPHLPNLINRFHQTLDHILNLRPDVVVTIDSPGFNDRIAKRLKKYHIPVVHYVAPTVWAWRPKRAEKVARFLTHLLTLFPFEPPYFGKEGLPTTFVGHPLVEIGFDAISKEEARKKLKLKKDERLILLLPGSREGEIKRLLPLMLDVVRRFQSQAQTLKFILVTLPRQRAGVQAFLEDFPIPIEVETDPIRKRILMRASDLALAASGTVSLELALCETPHIVSYKINPLTARIVKYLIRVRYVSLVNLLLDQPIVPELLQENCTAEKMYRATLRLLEKKPHEEQHKALSKIKGMLAPVGNIPSQVAADIILQIGAG